MNLSGPLAAADAEDAFRRAAALNRDDPLRKQQLLLFPPYGQVVMTGDMHGHRGNFEKLRRYAMLDRVAARHVILHELIHADTPPGVPDPSHLLFLEAARYKCQFPDQVHFLQSNHELSQLTNHQILKNGRVVLEDFVAGIVATYGSADAPRVYQAILDFIDSFPAAGRTPNRVWLSHSLPGADETPAFDPAALDRPTTAADREHGGPIYQLVWGRRFTPTQLDELTRKLDAALFIIGHQPQESGYAVLHDRIIVLASDHNHGTFLPIDLAKPVTLADLTANIHKFVEVL